MKTNRGTIVMLRISLILIIGFLCLFWFANIHDSKDYWESVGPQWDRMLNPNKYSEQE